MIIEVLKNYAENNSLNDFYKDNYEIYKHDDISEDTIYILSYIIPHILLKNNGNLVCGVVDFLDSILNNKNISVEDRLHLIMDNIDNILKYNFYCNYIDEK